MDKLSQAYIISSASQKRQLEKATYLAQEMLCSAPEEKRPCGVCRDCRKIKAGVHPDVIFIERQVDDKGKLRQIITVDQVRDMTADAIMIPNEARGKVFIIKDADTMNANAQNAALKSLEEPPDGVFFILCVSNAEKLLPTVRSRCTFLSVTGDEDISDEALKLAREYSELLESGDEPGAVAWCFAHDGMDAASLSDFLSALERRYISLLPDSRAPERVMSNIRLAERCAEYQKVNTSVKHIMGLLAARSAVETRK